MATAALGLFTSVFGAFSKHHAQAVANEAAGMNQAIPTVRQSFDAIMSEVNNGTITPEQGISYLDGIWPQYEDLVYNRFQIKRKDCNGPCVFEKQMKQDAENIKTLLRSGKAGSVTISSISPGRGYQNFPAYQLTYNGPQGIFGGIEHLLGLDSITGTNNMGMGTGIGSGIQIGNIHIPLILLLIVVAFFGYSYYGKK